MSEERRTIEIHIFMTEDGDIVVDANEDEAAQMAADEFPDDDVRQIAITIELKPPSVAPEPASLRFLESD